MALFFFSVFVRNKKNLRKLWKFTLIFTSLACFFIHEKNIFVFSFCFIELKKMRERVKSYRYCIKTASGSYKRMNLKLKFSLSKNISTFWLLLHAYSNRQIKSKNFYLFIWSHCAMLSDFLFVWNAYLK